MTAKVLDVADLVGEMALRAEALKALTNVFGDAFATEPTPAALARAIEVRPDVYQHLWYLIVDLVDHTAKAAREIEERLAEIE